MRVDETTNGFRDLLAGLVSKNVDAVFIGGIDAPFTGSDGICPSDLVSYWAASAALDDQVLCALPAGIGDIGEVALTQFTAEYRIRFCRPAEYYAPYAYDAMMVLADAMFRAGSTESSAVLRALVKTSVFCGLTGTISFDDRGDVRHPAISIFNYRGEERQPIRTFP